MDMMGVIRFCEERGLAEALELERALVLKTVLDEVRMQLDSGVTPKDAARSALTVLEIIAQNAHGEDARALPDLGKLEDALTLVLEEMLATEVPSRELRDTQALEAFFSDHALARTLNIPEEKGMAPFLDSIRWGLMQAMPVARIAEETLSLLEGVAASHAAATGVFSYQLVGHLQDELEAVIVASLLPIADEGLDS